MTDTDYRRLIKSVRYALEYLENEAQCYCYQDDPEYIKIKSFLEKVSTRE